MQREVKLTIDDVLAHPLVGRVRVLAARAGGNAYLVGGAVRDWLRTGGLPADLDFALIDCKASELAKALADGTVEGLQAAEQKSPCGHLVPLDWEFGIHRVVFDDGWNVDLADALDNDLAVDLARRDLTVNAMALTLQEEPAGAGGQCDEYADAGRLIDPFGGQADLQAGRIRMVSEANLRDDPLRLLRVFRFAATLNQPENETSIDPATLDVVRQHSEALWQAAGERIQYELFRLLSAERCFPALDAMADGGLLEVVLPELKALRAVPASGFHHLGLFDHTLELVRQTERLISDCPEETRAWLQSHFTPSVTRLGLLKLACLLHDIGKPDTLGTRTDPIHGERLTFYGHEAVGERMCDPLLRRLKVGNDVRAYLKKLVRWHLYPCQFGPQSPRKSVLRFYRRMGEDTPDVVLLALADRHSATGPWLDPAELEKAHADHLWLLANYEQERNVLKLPRLLDGHAVMATLGIGPGPKLREILDALGEAQQLGDVSTPEAARDWLSTHFG